MCDHPAIKAISFVGGNQAGEYIFQRGTSNGKRVQANLGAKNHACVLPDANREDATNQLTGFYFFLLTFSCWIWSCRTKMYGFDNLCLCWRIKRMGQRH
jgi:hypothetical protein